MKIDHNIGSFLTHASLFPHFCCKSYLNLFVANGKLFSHFDVHEDWPPEPLVLQKVFRTKPLHQATEDILSESEPSFRFYVIYNNGHLSFLFSSQQKTIINAMSVNENGAMVTAGMPIKL